VMAMLVAPWLLRLVAQKREPSRSATSPT
jgi:hypothetical protein